MEEIKRKSLTVCDALVKRSTAAFERVSSLSQPFSIHGCVPEHWKPPNGSPVPETHGYLELTQQKAPKITRGLKYMMHKERLRELGYLNLEKRKWRGNTIALYIYLMGRYRKVLEGDSSQEMYS